MCSRMSSCNTDIPSSSEENIGQFPDDGQFTGSTLYFGGKKDGISCTYCRRSHPTAKCNVITDVKARKAILRNKAKCFMFKKWTYCAAMSLEYEMF